MEFTVVYIGFLSILAGFISAMNRGVVKILSSGVAGAIALAVLLAGINFLPIFIKTLVDIDLTWKITLGVSAGFAFVFYVIFRLFFGLVFKLLFNKDGWLHQFVDGIPGGILSLFPSLVGVVFIFGCARVAGTLHELNYVDGLSREGIIKMGGKIPAYPFSASWRNGVESLPFVAPLLDLVDPFANRRHRNAAAILLASRSTHLKAHLQTLPETAELVESTKWADLIIEPGIADAILKLDRLAIVSDPSLQKAAADPATFDALTALNLRPALEGFVKAIPPMVKEPREEPPL